MGKKSSWSYTTGEKGRNRVRAFVDEKSGMILLEFYETSLGASAAKRKRVSTGHDDCDRAKRQADELAARISREEPPRSEELTLHKLFDIYLREVTPEKGESKRKHDHRCATMFLKFLGANRKASTLNRRDWDRFVNERRRGTVRPLGTEEARQVGSRVIAYDLKWLLSVLNWATLAGDSSGGMLLERNPLRGLPLPKEENPKRPLLLQGRYEAMLAVAESVDERLPLAMILAHETGHRIGAIRELRWSDIDLQQGRIRWRADADKLGREHWTPLTDAAVAALEGARKANPGLGEAWVFPAPADGSKPWSRFIAQDYWERMEKAAKLPHEARMGWHSLRRKFATELKETPLKDLCALGGWKNPQTILLCYQREDEVTMREALQNRKQLTAVG